MNECKYNSELKDNRIKNTARTGVVNLIYLLISTIVPFFIRTLMIYELGNEYAGVSSVLNSIISMLSMTEMGLGTAIVYFLYRPVAEGDVLKTEAYLYALRRAYRYIGCIIFGIGLVILPFLRFFINEELPSDISLFFVFLIYLVSVVIQYFILPEIPSLLFAMQRGDIMNLINLLGNSVAYGLQILAIIWIHSFTCYFLSLLFQTVFICILRLYVKRRYYSNIKPKGRLSIEEKKELKKRVVALLGHQIDEKLLYSIDNIVISSICGLTIVTIYGNYMYVVTALAMLLSTVYGSLAASMGNAIVTESKDSNFVRFQAVLWLNGIITVWACACMVCLYQPFMLLWMGKSRTFELHTMLLFCAYFFVTQIRITVVTFKNANGMWWEDRLKPYVSMLVNLVVDILLVFAVGVDGALISSILCILLIEIPWESKVLFEKYFCRSINLYFKSIIEFAALTILLCGITYTLCRIICGESGMLCILIRVVIVSLVVVATIFGLYRKSDELHIWLESVRLLFYEQKSR